MRFLSALLLTLALTLPATAQTPPSQPPAKFELTAPQSIDFKPGKLITITAKGAAKVTWDVATVPQTELDFSAQGTTLLLAMPPAGVQVLVTAAAVAGDVAVLAKTSITVKGSLGVAKAEKPPTGTVRHATLVIDSQAMSASLTSLRDSAAFRQACLDRGVKLRTIDIRDTDEAVRSLGFDAFYRSAGGPCLVLQDADAEIVPNGQVFGLKPTGDLAVDVKSLLELIDGVNRK